MGTTILIELPNGNTLSLQFPEGNPTIKNVKAEIEKKIKIPSDQINLFFNGKQLEDDKTFSDYGIEFGSSLTLNNKEVSSTLVSQLNEESEVIFSTDAEENEVISSNSLIELTESQTELQTESQTELQTELQAEL